MYRESKVSDGSPWRLLRPETTELRTNIRCRTHAQVSRQRTERHLIEEDREGRRGLFTEPQPSGRWASWASGSHLRLAAVASGRRGSHLCSRLGVVGQLGSHLRSFEAMQAPHARPFVLPSQTNRCRGARASLSIPRSSNYRFPTVRRTPRFLQRTEGSSVMPWHVHFESSSRTLSIT